MQMIDEEARLIVSNAYERTMGLLNEKRAELNLLAEKLLAQEVSLPPAIKAAAIRLF